MQKNIKLFVCDNYDSMSQKAAAIFAEVLNKNKNGAFGFATGSSPVGMYKALIAMQRTGLIDMTGIRAYNLDEYYPIKKTDPQSYFYFMRKNLFDEINLPVSSTFIPNGETTDPLKECEEYEKKLQDSGGIVLQILGIGINGHIGFNEPSKLLTPLTSYQPLAESTIEVNRVNFKNPDDIPKHSITMGIHSIMMAKSILLLANGENKAKILKEALIGPITTMNPASLLQLHQDVTVVADKAAASFL